MHVTNGMATKRWRQIWLRRHSSSRGASFECLAVALVEASKTSDFTAFVVKCKLFMRSSSRWPWDRPIFVPRWLLYALQACSCRSWTRANLVPPSPVPSISTRRRLVSNCPLIQEAQWPILSTVVLNPTFFEVNCCRWNHYPTRSYCWYASVYLPDLSYLFAW